MRVDRHELRAVFQLRADFVAGLEIGAHFGFGSNVFVVGLCGAAERMGQHDAAHRQTQQGPDGGRRDQSR